MDVYDAIRSRRSIRKFEDRPIPEDAIERLISALLLAPSAGNLQARKFYFVRDADIKNKLAAAALGQSFVGRAPLVVVACTDSRIESSYGERGTGLYAIQDTSASIMSMMLAATSEGLGTVWVGAFRENEVAMVLELPPEFRPVAIVPVGYPAKAPAPASRVTPEEAVTFLD